MQQKVKAKMSNLNQNLYQVSKQVLEDGGVPKHLADATSRVIATDDPSQHELGRNAADQELVKEAMQHFHHTKENEK
jgi:hypothetical protein